MTFQKEKKKEKNNELQPAGQDLLRCIKGASWVIEEKFLNRSLAARKGITVNTSGLTDQCEKKKSK